MRRIGTIPNQQDAERFQDYLLTLGIKAQVDGGGDSAVVWVLDEDQVEQAKSELDGFLQSPAAEKYVTATAEAQRRRDAEVTEAIAARKRHIDLRERWSRPLFMRVPLTMLLIVASVVATFSSSYMENPRVANRLFIQSFQPDGRHYETGLPDVRRGELWRLVTPIFLHGGTLHLLFNMYILFILGGSIEAAKGPWRFLGVVLFTAVTSNVAQYLVAGPGFGGMSGVGFGLFGYLWMKSRYAPEEGFYLPPYVVAQFLFWMVLCLTGLIGRIANTAHVVGLLAGMLLTIVPLLWRRLR